MRLTLFIFISFIVFFLFMGQVESAKMELLTYNVDNKIIIQETKQERLLRKATKLIVKFEGFSETCKKDNTKYSRGYGTTCPYPGKTISIGQAEEEMKAQVLEFYNRVISLNPNLSDNEIIGLTSFYYNTGKYNGTVEDLRNGNIEQVKKDMLLYIMPGSKYEKGLRDRRYIELAVMNGIYIIKFI